MWLYFLLHVKSWYSKSNSLEPAGLELSSLWITASRKHWRVNCCVSRSQTIVAFSIVVMGTDEVLGRCGCLRKVYWHLENSIKRLVIIMTLIRQWCCNAQILGVIIIANTANNLCQRTTCSTLGYTAWKKCLHLVGQGETRERKSYCCLSAPPLKK